MFYLEILGLFEAKLTIEPKGLPARPKEKAYIYYTDVRLTAGIQYFIEVRRYIKLSLSSKAPIRACRCGLFRGQ